MLSAAAYNKGQCENGNHLFITFFINELFYRLFHFSISLFIPQKKLGVLRVDYLINTKFLFPLNQYNSLLFFVFFILVTFQIDDFKYSIVVAIKLII